MRHLSIYLIFLLTCIACTNINRTIKVGYVKKNAPPLEQDSFSKEVYKNAIKENYDIILFDKIELFEVEQLIKSMPSYEFYIGKSENGKKGNDIQPIAYKREHFTVQTQAYLEIPSSTPSGHNIHAGSVVAVKLRENMSGRTLFALNAATSEQYINEQIYNIHKIIKSYTDNLPIILAGDFPEGDENIKLLTGHWSNLVKLDGMTTYSYLNKESRSIGHRILVNGFLSLDKSRQTKRNQTLTAIQYTISFNKNYRDARTQSQPYPVIQPLPSFEQKQFVFNKSLVVKLNNTAQKSHIVYTTDESEPSPNSPVYRHPILINGSCRVKMRSIHKDGEIGAIVCRYFIQTDKENYRITEITSDPPRNWIPKENYHLLTDHMKGDESRTHESWLPVEPGTTVSIKMLLQDTTKLNHICLSFSTPGKIKIPEIEVATIEEGIQQMIQPMQQEVMGGALSQCGTEGWIKLSGELTTRELMITIKPAAGTAPPLYIDEIVLQ